MDNYKAVYPIGIVAELLNIHPRTLRIYEREGLIKPACRNQELECRTCEVFLTKKKQRMLDNCGD